MTDRYHVLETSEAKSFDNATMFNHPDAVLVDPDLTIAEKRILLASWVSDANTVPHLPSHSRPATMRQALIAAGPAMADGVRSQARMGLQEGDAAGRRIIR